MTKDIWAAANILETRLDNVEASFQQQRQKFDKEQETIRDNLRQLRQQISAGGLACIGEILQRTLHRAENEATKEGADRLREVRQLLKTILKKASEVKVAGLLLVSLPSGVRGEDGEGVGSPFYVMLFMLIFFAVVGLSLACFACGWFCARTKAKMTDVTDNEKKDYGISKIWTTKNGGCFHSTPACPTLASSTPAVRRRCLICKIPDAKATAK